MPITLEDIASRLGISVMTVSRALNDSGYVKAATKNRVLEVAREVGYVPNGVARGLIRKRTNTIGLIVSNIRNPYYAALTHVIQTSLQSKGYSLQIYNTEEDAEQEKAALYHAMSQRCDGVMLSPVCDDFSELSSGIGMYERILFVSRKPRGERCSYVVFDVQHGAYLAVKHLLELGHREICHITGPLNNSSVIGKIAGYRQALEEFGLSIDEDRIVSAPLTLSDAYETAKDVVRRDREVTAIFCFSDWIASGVLKALMELEVSVPGEISLVGFDNIEIASLLSVRLTSVALPVELVGERAVEVLIRNIETEPSGFLELSQTTFQPQLVTRESTAPPRERRS